LRGSNSEKGSQERNGVHYEGFKSRARLREVVCQPKREKGIGIESTTGGREIRKLRLAAEGRASGTRRERT